MFPFPSRQDKGPSIKYISTFKGVWGCQMLTFDDMRGMGVSKMTMLAIFENLPLFFLESLDFQN